MESRPEFIQALADLRIFYRVTPETLEQVLAFGESVTIPAETSLFNEGDVSSGVAYILLSGAVSIIIGNQTIATVQAPSILGEYALISSEPRTATVRATQPCELLTMSEDILMQCVAENPDLNTLFMERVKENIRAQYGVFGEK